MATPRSPGAFAALLIAIPFALVLAWSQSAQAPSRAELAAALNRAGDTTITASDIRSIDCAAPDATGYACHWRQSDLARTGRLIVDDTGWRLVEGGQR